MAENSDGRAAKHKRRWTIDDVVQAAKDAATAAELVEKLTKDEAEEDIDDAWADRDTDNRIINEKIS